MANRWQARIPRIYSVALTLIGLFCALEALISACRAALKRAKAGGKNIVVTAEATDFK